VPLVALTGQRPLEWMHKESHQYVDLVEVMRPITKWNARVAQPEIIPEVVRKAFRVAEAEKPGATHLELPEDVMARPLKALALPRRSPPLSDPAPREVMRAAQLICEAKRPVVLAGNGVLRARAAPALREFVRATGISVAETFMGKGAIDHADAHALGTVGLQERDYELAGFEQADVVIAVGYDLVEHAPENWNARRDKTVVVIDSVPAEIDAFFTPAVELLGDVYHVLMQLAEECRNAREPRPKPVSSRLREVVYGRLESARDDDAFPVRPPRALWELRQALDAADMLISDVGLHKLWIARMFPAHEPNTVMIANGLAGMGFALPSAIAAKLVHPERRVVAVCGDGGFLMNCQELETATRLGTAFVTVIWEDKAYGSIAWKQRQRFDGEHFGTDFTNPDFVGLAESFGMPAWRCDSADDFGQRLRHALSLDVPSLIVLPIDYAVDIAISDELGEETVIRT
jgi:acetolactate synthase-1/2/3 large subunit